MARQLSPSSEAVEQAFAELGSGATKEAVISRADQLVSFDAIMRHYERGGRKFDHWAIKRIFLEDAFSRRSQLRDEANLLRKREAFIIDDTTRQRLYKNIEEMDLDEIRAVRGIKSDQEYSSRRQRVALIELELRIESRENQTGEKVSAGDIMDDESWARFESELAEMSVEELDGLIAAGSE